MNRVDDISKMHDTALALAKILGKPVIYEEANDVFPCGVFIVGDITKGILLTADGVGSLAKRLCTLGIKSGCISSKGGHIPDCVTISGNEFSTQALREKNVAKIEADQDNLRNAIQAYDPEKERLRRQYMGAKLDGGSILTVREDGKLKITPIYPPGRN